MDHTARFETTTLSKEYPLPQVIPEDAAFVLVRENQVGFRPGQRPTILFVASAFLPLAENADVEYLGTRGTVRLYVLETANLPPSCGDAKYSGVRELYGKIPDEELAFAGLAAQIADYHRATRFCGQCGHRTVSSLTERARVCPACTYTTYARISPAIIVLVRNGSSILMVHGRGAPAGRYSLIAGFIEPGESMEHAVHRELLEETGITIKNLRYIASEPWPFPNSLMFGFIADYAGGTLKPDGIEIESAGWFDRENLPPLPTNLSISYLLLESWKSGKFS